MHDKKIPFLVGLGVILPPLQISQHPEGRASDIGLLRHHLERGDQRVPSEQRVIAAGILFVDG